MSSRYIDKYEIISTLGRGSMGVVYKAKDPEIGRLVAIKTLKSVYMGDDSSGNEAMQRFRQESRSAGKLHHANIVTIFEAGRTEEGSPFIVMEYIEGRSLEVIISEQGKLDSLGVLHYLAQIAAAIDYAHSQNVIHRDIKPSNIIVDSRQRPYLLDFGVAKLSDTSLTPAGTVVGTPSYMSPEQIRGSELDGRTDIFSLAVVVFEAFTGIRPFPGKDFTTVVGNIIHKDPLSFAELDCELPKELEEVISRGLSKEREERFTSALELVDAAAQTLGVVIDGTGIAGGYHPEAAATKAPPRKSEDSDPTPTQLAAVGAEVGATEQSSSGSVQQVGSSEQQASPANGASQPGAALRNVIAEHRETEQRGGGDAIDTLQGDFDPSRDRSLETVRDRSLKQRSILRSIVIPAAAFVTIVGLVLLGGTYILPLLRDSTTGENDFATDSSKESPAELETVQKGSPAEPNREPEAEENPDPTPETLTAKNLLAGSSPAETLRLKEPPGGFDPVTLKSLDDLELIALLRAKDAEREELKIALEEATRRGKDGFLASIVQLSSQPDFIVRVNAIKALSAEPFRETKTSVDAVIARLDDSEYLVRGYAAKALRKIPGTNVLSALRRRLKVETNEVVSRVLKDAVTAVEGEIR